MGDVAEAAAAAAAAAEAAASSSSSMRRREMRAVKISLPEDCVAKKRRKHRKDELKPPEDEEGAEEGGGGGTATMEKDAEDDSYAEPGYNSRSSNRNPLSTKVQGAQASIQQGGQLKGSISDMGGQAMAAMQENFWLGKAAPAAVVGIGAGYALKKLKARADAEQERLVSAYGIEMLRYDGNQKVSEVIN